MKRIILIVISVVGLLLTVIPAVSVLLGKMDFSDHKIWMAAGMVLWFATAPFWMNQKSEA